MNIQNNSNVFNIANNRPGFHWPELTDATDFDAVLSPIGTGKAGGLNMQTGFVEPAQFVQLDKTIGQAVTRSDNGDALGVVGARYGIAPNGPIYQMMTEGAESALPRHALQGVQLKESASYGGQFTRIELLFDGLGADIRQLNGSSTQLLFKIGLTNSFNGSGAVRLFAGAEDLWCTNGCTSGEMNKKAARHTSGYSAAIFAGFIEQQCAEYVTRVRTWQQWASKQITPAEAEAVLNANNMAGRKVKKMMEQFERESGVRGRSVWALYSALTNYASHNSELFGVRNSGNVDNTAITLDAREREVAKLIESDAFLSVAA